MLRQAAVLLFLVCLRAAVTPTWETGNALAMDYRSWAELRNVRVQTPGIISAPELVAWRRVKAAWRRLEKQVDTEYNPK